MPVFTKAGSSRLIRWPGLHIHIVIQSPASPSAGAAGGLEDVLADVIGMLTRSADSLRQCRLARAAMLEESPFSHRAAVPERRARQRRRKSQGLQAVGLALMVDELEDLKFQGAGVERAGPVVWNAAGGNAAGRERIEGAAWRAQGHRQETLAAVIDDDRVRGRIRVGRGIEVSRRGQVRSARLRRARQVSARSARHDHAADEQPPCEPRHDPHLPRSGAINRCHSPKAGWRARRVPPRRSMKPRQFVGLV